MGDYNRNDRGDDRGGRRFDGRSTGGRSFGGGRDFGRPAMHRATCAECGKDCEVPFRPSGERPVYCSECFEKRGSRDSSSRPPDNRSYNRPNYENRATYSGPRNDSPQKSSSDFGPLMDQLKSLHTKLDKLISFMEPKPAVPASVVKEVTGKNVKPKAPKIEAADVVFEPKIEKTLASTTKKKIKEEKVDTTVN